jgi:hypothetical protein
MKRECVVVLVFFFWPTCVWGGVKTIRGTERGLWEKAAVVYAEVASVEQGARWLQATVTLDVKATLSGSLDAADKHLLKVDAECYPHTGIRWPPKPKMRLIVLVRREQGEHYAVPRDAVLFMPNRGPMMQVEGFDDPKVDRLLAALRIVRKLKDDHIDKIAKKLQEALDGWKAEPRR